MQAEVIPSYDLSRGDSLAAPIRLLRCNTAKETDGDYNSAEPHRHNYHEIFYFIKGGGWHDIDFRRFPIEDHAIHFVNPGQVHLMRRAPDSHGFIILFTSDFYMLDLHNHERNSPMWFLMHSTPRPALRVAKPERTIVLEAIRLMEEEFTGNGAHREQLLHSYLHILLLHSLRLFERLESIETLEDASHTLVNRLRSLIEENYGTVHAPREYAEMLCVSQNHLNNTTRRTIGKTIGDLVHERIILEAQRLLFHTAMSVKEIAFQLNYDDPSYFTRFFRKHTGVAPHEFREAARKKHH
ncbi:MAG TPA: helix-turn-helix transcriptional regulator [Candidatus Kapabacteria bacterium]|nr:helix-turn-helix transcriptional regulator [Candidatus Kapabacteria bacterium]